MKKKRTHYALVVLSRLMPKHKTSSRSSDEAALEAESRRWTHAAELFALSTLAVAQPLYDMFGKYPDFFTAHDARGWDIVLLAILLSFGLPLLLFAIETIAGAINRATRQYTHYALLVILAALTTLPILKQLEFLPDILAIAAASLAGLGFTVLIVVRKDLRKLLPYLAALTLLLPIKFLAFSPTSALVLREELATFSFAQPGKKVNVMFVVFEELPLASLMDENRQIDAIRYPNFARLADDAHWFRNFTVNGPMTSWSIPAMLTGRQTQADKPLLAVNYPESLFSLLGPTHQIQPFGHSRRICPRTLRNARERQPFGLRLRWTLRDMSVVYLHMVLPPGLSAKLPPVTDNWADFTESGSTRDKKGPRRSGAMGEFIRYVVPTAPSKRPTFAYLHSNLAHNPWRHLPSGKRYSRSLPGYRRDRPYVLESPGFGGKRWTTNEWLVAQGYQRHLLAVGAIDNALGVLIRHLKKQGIYDESLIVVTSDHGCSFQPGQRNRGRKGSVEGDTMAVPLLIKLPRQQQAVINDDNVEAVDILPTLADILDIEVPWPVDGRSVFDDSSPIRSHKTLVFFEDELRKTYLVEAANDAKYASLDQKLAIFGSGRSRPNGYFRFGPYADVVGKRAAGFPKAPTAGFAIDFQQKDAFEDVSIKGRTVLPCLISGVIKSPSPVQHPMHLAISVNGTIQAATQSYREPPSEVDSFYAIIPEKALREGKNKIEFFAILSADEAQVSLAPIAEILQRGAAPRDGIERRAP